MKNQRRNDYSEKLTDPRWQQLRLRVFERDGFKCRCCLSDKSTLHVHHLIYSKGEPWDAPIETLETLCKDCHAWREEFNALMGERTISPTRICYSMARLAVIWKGENGEVGDEMKIIAIERQRAFKSLCRLAERYSPVEETIRSEPDNEF